jgi:hypothetical protein
MRKRLRMHLDLFVPGKEPVELNGIDRQKVLTLLQTLLTEAAKKPARERSSGGKKEVGNE